MISKESPAGSPSLARKSRLDTTGGSIKNVFYRLQNLSENFSSANSKKGVIKAFHNTGNQKRDAPLHCTHEVQVSERNVCSVAVRGSQMITGSQDRIAKIWDLQKGEEIWRTGIHPNNVNCVRFWGDSNLLATVSMAQVRIWDSRSKNCVRTLNSSGLTSSGDSGPNSPSIQTTIPHNETMINAIAMGPRHDYLLTGGGNTVRIWDLRNFRAIGRLASPTGSPQSEVTCLATIALENTRNDCVITGSRDHYIKTYSMPADRKNGTTECSMKLEPPHYDGISCLTTVPCEDGARLFSASRDGFIMFWDLSTGQRLHQAKAHKTSILAMAALPAPYEKVVVSSCKDGLLKLWEGEQCSFLDEVNGHKEAINCIAVGPGKLYTASNDGRVNIWRVNLEKYNLEPETMI